MNIQGLLKTTLLDYPGHVAATIFFGGCNFRCPFCHNGDLVLTPYANDAYSEEEALAFFQKRQKVLDGVCISGGEPTLQEGLPDFLARIHGLGLSVKLDTNGYRPDVLRQLCEAGLVDYVAMDIKGSPSKYAKFCGLSEIDFSRIQESVAFLLAGSVDYEFRTTVTREFHQEADFAEIGGFLHGARAYYLQGYQDSPQVISSGFSAYTFEELAHFRDMLLADIPLVEIRGVSI